MDDKDRDENEQSFYRIMDRDHWRCQYPGCGKPATERAHRIAQTQANTIEVRRIVRDVMGRYEEARFIQRCIIHADKNMAASCRKHNDYFNIGNNPQAVRELVEEILRDKYGHNHNSRKK